jgi:hypothetical protein
MKIYVDIPRIGDTICVLPFLKYLADSHSTVFYGPHLNKWVMQDVYKHFVFDSSITPETADYAFSHNQAWDYVTSKGNAKMHLIQGVFLSCGIETDINYSFPFPIENTGSYDIVISPFASASQGNKIWQYEKWLELISLLPSNLKKTVIGAGQDDISWLFNLSNVEILIDQSLPVIVGVLKNCKLFVSIDTGTSHLAHLLKLFNHVLLYAHHCPIVENTYARKYKISIDHLYKHVVDIPVEPVIRMCNLALESL